MKRALSLLLFSLFCVASVIPVQAAWAAPEEEKDTATTSSSVREGDLPPYNTDPQRYRLEVDVTNCVITAYERDEQGLYTKAARQMIMSSGNAENRTPNGTFTIGDMRERFGYFLNFNVYAQYWTQVVNGVYFHSVLYSRRDESTMQSSSYRNLGNNVSHGCIRMYVEDARWIYYNIPGGTICTITSKPRDAALTKSVKSSVPANEYKPVPDPNPDPEIEYAYCNANNISLSTGFFGPKDKYVGSIDRGEKVEVLQRGKEYLKIRRENRREGYTWARYFQADEPGPIEVKKGEMGVAHLRKAQKLLDGPGGNATGVTARKNTDYYITEIKDEHFKVKMDSVEGWLPFSAADFMTYPEDTEMLVVSKISAKKLSMLAAPEKGAAVIAKLDFGDEGRIYAYNSDWVLVRCRGQFGYLPAQYVSVILSPVEEETEQDEGAMSSEVDPEMDPETQQNNLSVTAQPTASGEPEPSASPSTKPSASATAKPSASVKPSASASTSPTAKPTATPKKPAGNVPSVAID